MSRAGHGERSPVSNDDRGVSEVLGFALLIGIVMVGVGVVLFVGGDALDRHQQEVELSQAEHAMVQLDTEASRVALDGTSTQQVDLGLKGSGGSLDVDPDAGWMRVEHVNYTTSESTEVTNTSLGAVTYEHGETTVAYQGGGVWRSDDGDAVMRSRPEVHFQNDTLSMPIVGVERGSGVYSEVEISRSGEADQRFPNESANMTNKVDDSIVRVTVQSDYYEAWGRYFEDEQDATVQYDHENELVIVEFLAIPKQFSPQSGVIATAGPGEINLRGTGAYIDSYDSSTGPYDGGTSDGVVQSAGDVVISGNAEIAGDVNAGREIRIESSSGTIAGDANYTDSIYDPHDGVEGEVDNISGVSSVPPIDGYVAGTTEELAAENDNDEVDVIDGDELDFREGNELGPGEYYLENADISGETLVLDTGTENDTVTIAVRDWVNLESGGQIDVRGDGDVRMYVASEEKTAVNVPGEGGDEVHFFLERNSEVHVPGHESSRFMLFAPSEFEASFGGSQGQPNEFTGVIYAPAGEFGEGYVYLKHSDLYGAVVTGNLTLGQYGQVHFDHALQDEELPLSPTTARLEYLYVTEHEVEVSGR